MPEDPGRGTSLHGDVEKLIQIGAVKGHVLIVSDVDKIGAKEWRKPKEERNAFLIGWDLFAIMSSIAFKKKIFCPGALKPPWLMLSAGCTTTESPPVYWQTSAALVRRCP